MVKCKTAGCNSEITKKGHYLCLPCWKKENGKKSPSTKLKPAIQEKDLLSATGIAGHFSELLGSKISGQKLNGIINELGWISKPPYGRSGWVVTRAGKRKGGTDITSKDGNTFVKYPKSVLNDKALKLAVSEMMGEIVVPTVEKTSDKSAHSSTRKTHQIKTRDGHYVRSRGEALVDNFLYSVKIAHAYEQEVILEQNVTMVPDFIARTPSGNVYIEFWGMEGKQGYDTRKAEKIALYEKYDLVLVQVSPKHLDNLDAYLARELAPFGVKTAF
jgi:hypothetical protein